MNLESLLPLGSVVTMKDEEGFDAQFMVIGYFPENEEVSLDYLVTPYPQGMFELPAAFPVNSEDIDHVEYRGYETEQSRELLDATLEYMHERASYTKELADRILKYADENPEEFESIMNEAVFGDSSEPYGLE